MTGATPKRSARAKEIATAALQLFARKGYQAARLEEISALVGIGKSTVYDYFRNKEELFVAAVLEGAEQWFADLALIGRETHDPIERLCRIAGLYIQDQGADSSLKSRLFFEVLSQTLLQDGVFFHQRHLILNLYQRHVRAVADFMLEGVSSGALRPEVAVHSERIAINFLAWLDGLAMHSLAAGDQIDLRAQIDLFLKHMAPVLTPNDNAAA